MKKRTCGIGKIVLAIATLSACCVLTAFSDHSSDNISDVRSAIIGAFETQVQMGMFESEDGFTASLSASEIETIISEYDKKVDLYYADANFCNEYYKWLNREYLTSTYKTTLDNCIDGGISQCDIINIDFNSDNTEATADVVLTGWNKWVAEDENDGSYIVLNPIDRDIATVKMVKEDNQWKLLETLSYDKAIHGYDESMATTNGSINDNDTVSITVEKNTYEFPNKVMSDAARNNIISEIQKNKAILAAKYDTYQDARAAVESININTGNYLALIQQLPTIR